MFDMLKAAVSNKHYLHNIAKSQHIQTYQHDSQQKAVSPLYVAVISLFVRHNSAASGAPPPASQELPLTSSDSGTGNSLVRNKWNQQ